MDLQPPAEDFHQPRDLTESDNALVGNIGDVAFAVERQEMVFAQAEEVDIPDHHHLVIFDREQSAVQDLVHIFEIPFGQEAKGLINALRGSQQSLAGRIFSKGKQNLFHKVAQFDRGGPGQRFFFVHRRLPAFSPRYSK